jgi:regulator of sirC expression with transglutaminase-like and TPR domain
MSNPKHNRKAFLTAVQQPAEALDTARCALLFSQAINPTLDIEHQHSVLNALQDEAESAQIDSASELLSFVHGKHNFRGNPDDYYLVDNSLLDCVLEKRVGIPISLALIYLAVGARTALSVYGISFPGHFLVGVGDSQSDIDGLIDPFAGQLTSRARCFDLLDNLYRGQVEHSDKYFEPCGNDTILLRSIENVKAIYLKQGDADRALTCLDYQLLVAPEQPNLLHQQQQLLQHINQHGDGSSVIH